MSKKEKFRDKILSGEHDKDIEFDELCTFVQQLGFERRKGRHKAIFYKDGVREILNLQARNDGAAKPYQVKQVREIVLSYKL
jgi:hypothetical protein